MAESRRTPEEVNFAVTAGNWTPKKRGTTGGKRERSDYMKALDDVVAGAYDEKYEGDAVFLEVDADTQAVADMERRIRNSGSYLGMGIRFGEEQPSETKGKLIMSFIVGKKIRRRTKKTDGE